MTPVCRFRDGPISPPSFIQEEASDSDGGSKAWRWWIGLIIGLGGAVLVCTGCLVLALYILRRRKVGYKGSH